MDRLYRLVFSSRRRSSVKAWVGHGGVEGGLSKWAVSIPSCSFILFASAVDSYRLPSEARPLPRDTGRLPFSS